MHNVSQVESSNIARMEIIMEYNFICKTQLGRIKIVESNNCITNIQFIDKNAINSDERTESKETPLIIQTVTQLEEYIAGTRKNFTVHINPMGTEFQKNVWNILQRIPYGEHWSYKQVAIKLGKPTAARAVGMANNKNPIAIIIPCHRVIGASGNLVGYAGGLEIKEKLLKLEKSI